MSTVAAAVAYEPDKPPHPLVDFTPAGCDLGHFLIDESDLTRPALLIAVRYATAVGRTEFGDILDQCAASWRTLAEFLEIGEADLGPVDVLPIASREIATAVAAFGSGMRADLPRAAVVHTLRRARLYGLAWGTVRLQPIADACAWSWFVGRLGLVAEVRR